MFQAAHSSIVCNLKHPKYLSVGKWRTALWQSHPESTVHIGENELALHVTGYSKIILGNKSKLQTNII